MGRLASAGRLRFLSWGVMRIKFLEICQSDVPSMPFQAGQIISISSSEIPTAFRSYIKRGQAVVLPDDVVERAVQPDVEKPEPPKVTGRKRVDS